MAIQTINLGSMPLGAGGDTQRAANEKINQNFSNSTHAASRLVGTNTGNVPEYRDAPGSTITAKSIAGTGWGGYAGQVTVSEDSLPSFLHTNGSGIYRNTVSTKYSVPFAPMLFIRAADTYFLMSTPRGSSPTFHSGGMSLTNGSMHTETKGVFYTDLNTTKDVATGFLKASSPVLHVYNDSITKIHEAEQLDIKVDKKGVGHYEIHGTTGLRKNDGWFMSPPRDMHSNVLCMVDYEEKDGVIILKTYKKKFDFETVSIVHDYDNPMDIPEGACVEFRFNDLPQELINEPIE